MADILYITQFFSTEDEPGGQGQRHSKHAKALAEDGHQVTVLTTGLTTMVSSNEPHSMISAKKEHWIHPNLEIVKIDTPPMRHRSVISRALRYFHFSAMALLTGLNMIMMQGRHFQFVLGSSPPLLIGLVGFILAFVAKASFLFEIRDLWSQTMAANGFIKNPFLLHLNRELESMLYRFSSKIIVLSPAFTDEIEAQVPGSRAKIAYIPNGADLEFYEYPNLWRGSYFGKNPIALTPEEKSAPQLSGQSSEQAGVVSQEFFNVIYAGVFSDYTRLEVLLEAANRLKQDYPKIRLHLAGGGYQLNKLKAMSEEMGLSNIKFWDALPKNRVTKFIMEGDLSIINYRSLEIFAQVLPNKLFEYLAAGRPILAATPEGEVSRIIQDAGCGRAVPAEDVDAIVKEIIWFYENQMQGNQMGLNGQRYVRRHFNRAKLVDAFKSLFPRVISIEAAKSELRGDFKEAIRQAPVSNVLPFKRRQ